MAAIIYTFITFIIQWQPLYIRTSHSFQSQQTIKLQIYFQIFKLGNIVELIELKR